MSILSRMQHAVPNFEGWKKAFDSEPMDRTGSGVRRFQVHRPVAEPLQKLRNLWAGAGKAVMQNPEAWIVETVESKAL